ncbi:MAG TPA: SDR family oxidoreductase [Spirochaetota bacterium]|nr:SDR family oxidoreductase [Spirochaetota bacterium]HPI91291.1 SDR family oxidoreductase [Spirochaetota bacterium]HPR48366.1 SDR family oxidoreductase [Spirochaetota bacterium]
MKMLFNERTVIVTGAGAGIGREYALEFARRGARVVVNDLGVSREGAGKSSGAADAVVEEIKAAGGTAVANYDDVSTEEGGRGIVQTAMDSFGRLDVLVNNAGFVRDKTFAKMAAEEWDAVIRVHLRGAFCVTRAALEIMRTQNYGRVIMTSSTSGLFGNYGQSNYGAAKLGLVGFMNVLKLENQKFDIHINAIAPTAASRMTEGILPPQLAEKMHPKFNVPMVVYLCHEDCAENGSIFVMGGGWFAKAAIVCGKGFCIGDTKRDIAAEEIMENFAEISNLDEAKSVSNIEVFGLMSPLWS